MWSNIRILLVCACAVTAQVADWESDIDEWENLNFEWGDIEPKGPISDKINDTINAIKENLTLIPIKNFPFKTGPQQFGSLNGRLYELEVTGLSDLVATVIDFNALGLKLRNLTIEIPTILVRGKYLFDGNLSFPLGEGDIHFYGDGDLDITVLETVASVTMRIGYTDGKYVCKDFEYFLVIGDIKAKLTNLMGGGDMGDIFNDLINDVALAIVNFYKDPILEGLKPFIVKKIDEVIDQLLNNKP